MKMKHLVLSGVLLLSGCAQPVTQTEEPVYENMDFTAVVVSDLHYISSPSGFNSAVPLEYFGSEVTDALIGQTIALSADAFIMTGDNTNNGREKDVKELAEKLKRLRDAGIEIIIIPGNHDYGQGSMNAYEKHILPLLDMDERDASSFSYVSHSHGTAIFAMDDSHAGESEGYFSRDTMNWLNKQLDQEQDRILFLSHHNIISGICEPIYSRYLIQNDQLYDVLRDAGVRLCMSGHQHNQSVYHLDGMYEILSGMPFSSAHTFGLLRIDDEGVSYQTMEIDLEKYGAEGLCEKADAVISEQNRNFYSVFEELCKEKELDEADTEKVIALIIRFFEAYNSGTLIETAADILNDSSYGKMQEVLWDKNYGPWMEGLLKNLPMDGNSLSFRWDSD